MTAKAKRRKRDTMPQLTPEEIVLTNMVGNFPQYMTKAAILRYTAWYEGRREKAELLIQQGQEN